MSQLNDLHARMSEITRRLTSQGAGKATQAIQDALAAAGLMPRPGDFAPMQRTVHEEASPGARPNIAPQAFVADLLARLGVTHDDVREQEPEQQTVDENGRGRFVTGSYSNAAGRRRYKVYIPGSYDGQPMPLVVMLHGCTQNPDDFARGTQMNILAEEKGFLVVYPAQDAAANPSKCWNWFQAIDQKRGQGEPSLIAGITNEVIEQYGLNRSEVFVAGLSAGGAMAVIMGSTYPDLYSAVGVHSGLPYASASDLPSALSAMQGASRRNGVSRTPSGSALESIPIIVFHGDHDATVNPANGMGVIDDFITRFQTTSDIPEKMSTVVEEGKINGGHRFSRTSLHVDGQPVLAEHWLIHGAGHAWAGGSSQGSFTDAKGPDASKEMFRFFSTQALRNEH
ncbi:MAG: esterase [Herbaspirillum sp.]|jgi:poly(hydroxyalkanoate) depolymerase family esterase|nr:esterase [Herbaspirillum sp.]